jgi:hypothetical protein
LLSELNQFRGGNAMADDQTFLLLAEESSAPPKSPRRRPIEAAPIA